MTYERKILFNPAFDKTNADRKKNYGIGNMTITFVVKAEKGAVVWTIFTGWYVRSARDSLRNFPKQLNESPSSTYLKPWATDLGYHSLEPVYEDQYAQEGCYLLDGKTCYYDGTTLGADEFVEGFLAKGDDWLFSKLEQYYEAIFNGSEYPTGAF